MRPGAIIFRDSCNTLYLGLLRKYLASFYTFKEVLDLYFSSKAIMSWKKIILIICCSSVQHFPRTSAKLSIIKFPKQRTCTMLRIGKGDLAETFPARTMKVEVVWFWRLESTVQVHYFGSVFKCGVKTAA